MKLEKVTGSPAIVLEFEEERHEVSPTKIGMRNESVTGRIYNHVVKIRKAWNVSAYFTKAEKEQLLMLAEEHYVKATIEGTAYYCVLEIRNILALEMWSGAQCHKADFVLEERGYGV